MTITGVNTCVIYELCVKSTDFLLIRIPFIRIIIDNKVELGSKRRLSGSDQWYMEPWHGSMGTS